MNLCDEFNDNMVAYRKMYNLMQGKFEGCELKHIVRASNEEAETLANIGSTCSAIPDVVFYEVINQRSVKVKPHATPPPPHTHTRGLALASWSFSSSQFGLNHSLHIFCGKNYLKIHQRRGPSPAAPKHMLWWKVTSTSKAYRVYFNGASHSKMERGC
jgi:hypothetical protein